MHALGKFVLGGLLGGICGSILGLLFAPVSGNELRERVYDYCTNIRNEVSNAATEKSEQLQKELFALQNR